MKRRFGAFDADRRDLVEPLQQARRATRVTGSDIRRNGGQTAESVTAMD
jgi:hypothetical protein